MAKLMYQVTNQLSVDPYSLYRHAIFFISILFSPFLFFLSPFSLLIIIPSRVFPFPKKKKPSAYIRVRAWRDHANATDEAIKAWENAKAWLPVIGSKVSLGTLLSYTFLSSVSPLLVPLGWLARNRVISALKTCPSLIKSNYFLSPSYGERTYIAWEAFTLINS